MTVETTSGFMAWIQQYGQVVLYFAQLLFWIAIAVAAVWSTLLFRKFVAARTPSTDAGSGDETAAPAKPSIDDFVE